MSKKSAARDLFAFQQQTQIARSGKDVNDPLISEFVLIAKEHDFSWEWIEVFFDAMRMDTEIDIYTTYEQLQ